MGATTNFMNQVLPNQAVGAVGSSNANSGYNFTPDMVNSINPTTQDTFAASGSTAPMSNSLQTLFNLPNQQTSRPTVPNPYSATETPSDPYSAARATSAGNLYGAQAATSANRVNQITPYGSLNYQQTGTDAYGNPIYSASQTVAPELQGALSNLTQNVNQVTGQQFNPNLPSTGINPGQTYSDAIMKRLQPVQERQANQLQARLANQGIMPGSEAYKNAMTDFSQQQNDQLTSAIVGGMNTGLQANQQAYNQALTNYQLPLSQLSAFRSATAPNYVNPYQQAAVSGPDLSTAYAQQQATNIAQQNADTARQAAMMGGLFGLGSSALSNPTSVGNILSGAGDIYSTVKGWF